MKHKYAEMIKAKVDNMDSVLLVNVQGEWKKSCKDFPTNVQLEYFLCHPKHANTCLHCLNGGKAQLYSGDRFHDMPTYSGSEWSPDCVFMDADREIRIKPKKEKRWIVVYGSHWQYCSNTLDSHSRAENYAKTASKRQIIEIEIEVE